MSNCFMCKYMNWEKYNKIHNTGIADGKYCLKNKIQISNSHCFWSENSASKCEGYKDYCLEQMLYTKEEILLINIIEYSFPYLEYVFKYGYYKGFTCFEGIYTRIEQKRDKIITFNIYKNFSQEILNKIAISLLKNKYPNFNFETIKDENLKNFIIIEKL